MSQLALYVSFEYDYLCYVSTAIIMSFSAGIHFRRHILTFIDVRFWRLKTVPALKVLTNIGSIGG